MAGSGRRERRAAATNGHAKSGNQNSIFDRSIYDKIIPAKDKKPVKFSVRPKALEIPSEPGSWQNKLEKPKIELPNGYSKNTDGSVATSLVNPVNSKIAQCFPTGKPFEETSNAVLCKHCKKPVYKTAAPSHIKDCLKKKQEKLQKKKEAKEAKDAALRKERNGGISPEPLGEGSNGKNLNGSKKSAVDADGLAGQKKTGKKRKAGEDGAGPLNKKKKKDEGKPKTAKSKAPVDVEKQCGVILPNGGMCARSLTCKSHSMGAKRLVPGRSMRYDILLAQYQKKNHARQHKAAMDANAALEDDFEQQGQVDSDEERDSVMTAVSRYIQSDPFTGARIMGRPLETWNPIPISRRYKYIRFKGALKSSMDAVHGSKIFSTPAAPLSSALFSATNTDLSATLETFDQGRRSSMGLGRPVQRKQSVGPV